jgi:hypothetical protein
MILRTETKAVLNSLAKYSDERYLGEIEMRFLVTVDQQKQKEEFYDRRNYSIDHDQ